MQREIKPGMTLWKRETDRRGNGIGITNVTVETVGRKYLTLTNSGRSKYDIQTLRIVSDVTVYGGQLYFDRQDILDENEHSELTRKIQKHFDSFHGKSKENTLPQLRAACEALCL